MRVLSLPGGSSCRVLHTIRAPLGKGLHRGAGMLFAGGPDHVECSVRAVSCNAHLCTDRKSTLFIRDMCEYIMALKIDGH